MAKGILDPNFLAIETIFKQCCFNVPIYQRPYSWDREQVETLLNDIDAQFKKDRNLEYYMGNIIIFDKDQKTNGVIVNYDIIDGQQRTVTFSLLFLAIYCIANRLGFGNDREIANLKDIIWHPIDRNNSRETRLVNISSTEKDCYENLYDQCFEKPIGIVKYCKDYETKSMFEKRIIDNFLIIYDFLEKQYANKMYEILDYTNYLLNKVKLIQIEASCPEKDVFSMFESINSKGKQLDPIDIIKSYIFSMLNVEDYEECSKIWGKLTIETNDNLYNYLYVYIRANLFYYKQRFSVAQFKSLCEDNLKTYFKVNDVSVAIRKLLEDLDAKLNEYKMLESLTCAEKYFSNVKFKFFYSIFLDHKYEHPRALFFRIFNDYNCGKISKEEAIAIIDHVTLMMFEFMTILGKDSKDCVNTFANIMKTIHETGVIKIDAIKTETEALFKSQNITREIVINQLSTTDTYTNRVSVPLLALYNSTTKKDASIHVSYDEAFAIYESFSDILSLDHMLVRTPDENDDNFYYFKNAKNNTLCLKDGNDFPPDIANDGMDYDDFTKYILNRIGNLRILYRDKNSSRQNTAIDLLNEDNIFTFEDIKKRSEKILGLLFNSILVDI